MLSPYTVLDLTESTPAVVREGLGDIGKLGECAGIDARQRHEDEETENDQRADREPDALLELGCLGEIGETDIARETVGA